MAKLIMYLLESSAVLALLYLVYVVVLRKETFFDLNRFFLIGILMFSLLFPFVSFDFNQPTVAAVDRPIEEISRLRTSYFDAMARWEYDYYRAAGEADAGSNGKRLLPRFDWIEVSVVLLFVVYAIGVVVSLSRTVYTLVWIRKMIRLHPRTEQEGLTVVLLPQPVAPFSFMKYVFVHSDLAGTPEFDQVLAHERTHIEQKHSVDLIFVQLLAAFFWFNPVIWRLIKSLKTTHEYIADEKIISSGYSLVEYQTLLLQQLISNNSYGLVHNFNLSFIKKRITMMTNQKSGWSGKVRVALALAGAALFSVIVVQCNSKMDEPAASEAELATESSADFAVNLPVLPDNGYTFDGNTTDALNISVADNQLTINGKPYKVEDIAAVVAESKVSDHSVMIIRADKDQPMKFVKEIQMELRKADRRKILYMGQTVSGKSFEMPFLLPPTPGTPTPDGKYLPVIDDEYAAEHDMDIVKIRLGDNAGVANQQLVYDFVKDQMGKGKSNYVISAGFDEDDTYGDYLVNLAYIQEGFNQIYQERSQQMFGKDFYDIAANNKEQYQAVRQGIPRAISVAEH
jgi:biopolymer transport protein ExbD